MTTEPWMTHVLSIIIVKICSDLYQGSFYILLSSLHVLRY